MSQTLVRLQKRLEFGTLREDDVDILRQSERRPEPAFELGGRRDRAEAIECRIDAHARGGNAHRDVTASVPRQNFAAVALNPSGQARHQQRASLLLRRPLRQERRHHHERQHAADDHAVADQHPELLQAWKVDEREAIEGCRGRPHAEQHARRRTRKRRAHIVCTSFGNGETMSDVKQHDAVHAETEEDRCRARCGGRDRCTREAEAPERDEQRQSRWQRSNRHEPQAAERDEQQRQDRRERFDRVQNALALDDAFGFDRDAVPAGEFHLERLPWIVTRRFSIL